MGVPGDVQNLLRYHSKDSLSRIYEIANLAHSSDEIEILKDTALKHVIMN